MIPEQCLGTTGSDSGTIVLSDKKKKKKRRRKEKSQQKFRLDKKCHLDTDSNKRDNRLARQREGER